MLYALVILPLFGALAAWLVPSNRHRPLLLPLFALLHTGLTVAAFLNPSPASPGGWILLDPLGKIILGVTTVLFLVCAVYAVGYLDFRQERSNRVLCAGLLVCLAAMTLATMCHHLGLLCAVAGGLGVASPQGIWRWPLHFQQQAKGRLKRKLTSR